MKKISAATLAITFTLGVNTLAQAEAVKLTGETSSKGSSPHFIMTHLGEVASKAGIASIQVADGQTLTNSVKNVAEGRTDIASGPVVLPFLLSKGVGPYSALDKAKAAELAGNLRALYPYNAGAQFMVAFQSKGLKGWADLEGKTVFNGPPRGAALTNARQLIKLNTGLDEGKGYKGVQANWDALNNMMVDGSADAFVIPITLPSPRISLMSSAGKVNLYSTPKAVLESDFGQKLTNFPGLLLWEGKISQTGYADDPNVSIISDDEYVRGVGPGFAELVNKSMSFDLAKALTAEHIKTLEALKQKAPFLGNVGLAEVDPKKSAFCGKNVLKYHAGAVAAWTEAGYNIPACARAN